MKIIKIFGLLSACTWIVSGASAAPEMGGVPSSRAISPSVSLMEQVRQLVEQNQKLEARVAANERQLTSIASLTQRGDRVEVGSSKVGAWTPLVVPHSNLAKVTIKFATPFEKVPKIFTSIRADYGHWATTGATSIYCASREGFVVLIRYSGTTDVMSPSVANQYKYVVDYVAIGGKKHSRTTNPIWGNNDICKS